MIIEFLGLPGCGKSTVASQLAEMLRRENKTVITSYDYEQECNRRADILRVIKCVDGLRFLLRSIELCAKNCLLYREDVFKRIVSCLAIYSYYVRKAEQCEYLILDEGMAQGIVSALYTYNRHAVSFSDLIKCNKKEVKYIYINSTPELSADRIEIRKTYSHGRCDGILDINTRIAVLAHEKRNFETMYKNLRDLNNENVILLQADMSISDMTSRIVHWLNADI